MNTDYLPQMITDLFDDVVIHAGDACSEDEVMKVGIAAIRKRTVQEFKDAIDRIKRRSNQSMDLEIEEVP